MLIALIVGAFGLIIGSFLNVVIWRVPRGESLIPDSHCPKCNYHIQWWLNVPVLAWIGLKGKCKNCKEPISMRYPLIELLTGLLFFTFALFLPIDSLSSIIALVAILYFVSIGVALSMIDLDTKTLPDKIVLPSYIVVFSLFSISSIISGSYWPLLQSLIGGVSLFLFYFALAMVKKDGMGGGDIKLSGVIGLILGWFSFKVLIVGAFMAFMLSFLFTVPILIFKKYNNKTAIPFGPWMFLGAWISIFVGDTIANSYLSTIS